MRQALQDLPPAPHVCGEGPGSRHEQLLPPVRVHPAVAAARGTAPRCTAHAVAAGRRGPRQAGRTLRVHLVRLLLHVMSVLLVERNQISRPRCAHAGNVTFIVLIYKKDTTLAVFSELM